MKDCLFITQSAPEYSEMITLATGLLSRGANVDYIHFCEKGSTLDNNSIIQELFTHQEKEQRLNVIPLSIVDLTSVLRQNTLKAKAKGPIAEGKGLQKSSRLKNIIKRFIIKVLGYEVINQFQRKLKSALRGLGLEYLNTFYHYKSTFNLINDYFKNNPNVATVILPEEVVGCVWSSVIKAAHENGVKVFVFPYTLANEEEAFQSLKHSPRHQTSRNIIAAHLFPKWRRKKDNFDIVRMPTPHILAHQFHGTTPSNPWVMNSGDIDYLCVDSKATYDYFAKAGIDKNRIVITGSLNDDEFWRASNAGQEHRHEYLEIEGFDPQKPTFLIAGCPNQLAAHVPGCDFNSMAEILEDLAQSLLPIFGQYNVVVRPHPRYKEFAEYLEKHGALCTMAPTASLVPNCDVFFAFASATIRWAINCAKPTINYDVFNYDYSEYKDTKGVISVNKSEELRLLLEDFAPNSDNFRKYKTYINEDSKYWSMMDGKCLDRIENLINHNTLEPQKTK